MALLQDARETKTKPKRSHLRVVVLGAGFGGATAARELVKRLPKGSEVVLLDRNNYTLYEPLLVEAGVGTLEPRHVTIPIRAQVPNADFRMAEITGIDLRAKRVDYRVVGGEEGQVDYDHLVFALGSVTRIPDTVPGLREHGYQLKSLVDAIALRDRAIQLLELANLTEDRAKRREILTFVIVGANFTGVELAGEYHAFLHDAIRRYPNLRADDLRVLVLEFADRILGGTSVGLARWCQIALEKRGVEFRLGDTVLALGADFAQTKGGECIPTRTVVWAAGIAPSPAVGQFGLPTNARGYIEVGRDFRVNGLDEVWAIGDSAAVPTKDGVPYAATAQNATREGPLCARNIVATLQGLPTKPFDFRPLGNFAAIGRRQAAAEVFGLDVKGLLGWLLYRGAYLMKMPTTKLKLRLIGDWIGEILFPHDPVQLGLHERRVK